MDSRTRTSLAPALDLPPPFRLVTLREVGDAFAHAKAIAAEAGAGTLVYVGRFDLVEFAVAGGKAGYLRPRKDDTPRPGDANLEHLSSIIDALGTPIAIFNANRELVQSNRAYAPGYEELSWSLPL